MNEQELRMYVGNKIREFRKKEKMTQKSLGEKLGVKHNTISQYEKGISEPDQNTLYKLAKVFDKKVDDFFPETEHKRSYLDQLREMNETDLDLGQMHFLQSLIDKAISFEGEDREKFLESIQFTIDYYEKMSKKD